MELHRENLFLLVFHGGQRIRSLGGALEAGKQVEGFVAVRHPYLRRARQILKERRAVQQLDLSVSILPLFGRAYFAAQLVRDELQSVADAKHGDPKRQHALIRRRSIFVIDRAWPAAQNDARRRVAINFFQRRRAGQHDRKHILFAHTPGDKLRVLLTKIEDDNALGGSWGLHVLILSVQIRRESISWSQTVSLGYAGYTTKASSPEEAAARDAKNVTGLLKFKIKSPRKPADVFSRGLAF